MQLPTKLSPGREHNEADSGFIHIAAQPVTPVGRSGVGEHSLHERVVAMKRKCPTILTNTLSATRAKISDCSGRCALRVTRLARGHEKIRHEIPTFYSLSICPLS
jgi:hypothetical protein